MQQKHNSIANALELCLSCTNPSMRYLEFVWKFPKTNSKQKLKFFEPKIKIHILYVDKLVQERHNSIANALELCLSCTNPSMWYLEFVWKFPWTNSKQKLKFLEPKFWRGRFGYNDRLHQVTLAPSNYGWPAIMGEAADAPVYLYTSPIHINQTCPLNKRPGECHSTSFLWFISKSNFIS